MQVRALYDEQNLPESTAQEQYPPHPKKQKVDLSLVESDSDGEEE